MRRLLPVTLLALCRVARADADADIGAKVQQLLRAHQRETFACVAAQPTPIVGEALLRFIAGQESVAAQVAVLKVDAAARATAECVAGSARSWDLSALRLDAGDQIVVPLVFRPEAPGAANVAVGAQLSHVSLRAGASTAFSARQPMALYVERIEGGLTTVGEKTLELGAGDVMYLPQGATLELRAKKSALLVQVVASGSQPGGGTFPLLRRASEPAPIALPDGKSTAWLYLDGVAAPFALDRLCAKKGASIPRHQHDSDELLYVLSGHGVTTLGDHEVQTAASDFVTIPRGTPHALRVDADLCAVQVYAPSGPEQRWKH